MQHWHRWRWSSLTFSHKIFTWFSDSCLHSFSCSIHWSSSFVNTFSSILDTSLNHASNVKNKVKRVKMLYMGLASCVKVINPSLKWSCRLLDYLKWPETLTPSRIKWWLQLFVSSKRLKQQPESSFDFGQTLVMMRSSGEESAHVAWRHLIRIQNNESYYREGLRLNIKQSSLFHW